MNHYLIYILLLGTVICNAFAKPKVTSIKKIDDYNWVNGLGFHKKETAEANHVPSWYESKKKIPSLPIMRSFKKTSTGFEIAQLHFNIPNQLQKITPYSDDDFAIQENVYQNPEGYKVSFLSLSESQSRWRWSSHEFKIQLEAGYFKIQEKIAGSTLGYLYYVGEADGTVENTEIESIYFRMVPSYTYTLNFKFPMISKYFVTGPLVGVNPEISTDIRNTSSDPLLSIGAHYGANFKLFVPMMGHQDFLYFNYRIKFYHMIKSFSYTIENSTPATQIELELGINYSIDNQFAFKYTYNGMEERENRDFNYYSILDHSYSLIFRF